MMIGGIADEVGAELARQIRDAVVAVVVVVLMRSGGVLEVGFSAVLFAGFEFGGVFAVVEFALFDGVGLGGFWSV